MVRLYIGGGVGTPFIRATHNGWFFNCQSLSLWLFCHREPRNGFNWPITSSYAKGYIPMKEKIEAAINKIRPMLQADGGNVELVSVSHEGVVQVRLKGACSGCPMSQMTLKNGIERIIKKEVPEVKSVEAVK